jgi:site-specific DNA-methyltransferase (adenine-specific)
MRHSVKLDFYRGGRELLEVNKIHLGDCLELMREIPDASVDMILCDLPYGTTACKWDTVIPFEPLWEQYERIIKDNGAIVLTGQQPFSSIMVSSNLTLFKYSLVWKKSRPTYFAQAPYRFMSEHEDILIFSKGGTAQNAKNRMKYNPQGLEDTYRVEKGGGTKSNSFRPNRKPTKPFIQTKTNYPRSVLEFASEGKPQHPTQKPIALFEYLIKSYSDEGDLVLDNCIGSGTTAIAAINTNRNFIGIEKDPAYYQLACERVENHLKSMQTTPQN